MNIHKKLLPKAHRNRPGLPMKPIGVLFHTTNNWSDGAGDELHGKYMENTLRTVSWHVTVDKDSYTQHIPFNENAWHAGDGTHGHYNRNWIGVEIACEAVKQGEPLDKVTYDNAVYVATEIMRSEGITKLEPHAIVKGKDCPHHTLFNREQFKKDVYKALQPKDNYPEDTPQWKKDRVDWMFENGLLESKEWKMKLEESVPLWALADILQDFKKGVEKK